MSNFDKNSLEHLEKLCRIKLTEEEKKIFLKDLKQVLDYVEKLNEVNTKDVKPCDYVLQEIQNIVMREDIVQNTISRDVFLSNAPEQIGGMIKVPPIIKSE